MWWVEEETDTASCSQCDSCELLIPELDITWSLIPRLAVHAYTTRCCLSGRRLAKRGTRSNYTRQDECRSWRGREVRVATYRGKIHGGKSVLGVYVARGEFGEITRGEIIRFYCIRYRPIPRFGWAWVRIPARPNNLVRGHCCATLPVKCAASRERTIIGSELDRGRFKWIRSDRYRA